MALNGPGALDVRTGIMFGPTSLTTGVVTGTSSTSPWQYSVPQNTYVTSKGALDGPRQSTNDGTVLVSTIAPPGSNSRYDLIYVMQQDADATISPDGTTAPLISVVNGASGASPSVPALPAGAIALATALVASTATTGTSGANVTIDTTVSRFTSTRFDPIPVRNATERAEITGYAGVQAQRLDLGVIETYDAASSSWIGGAWTAPTLTNSWVNYGSGHANAAFRKTADGSVALRGSIKLGTVSQIACTLPTGYAPQNIEWFTCTASGGTCSVQVNTAGNVTVLAYYAGGTNLLVSLAGIRFSTL